MSYVLDVATVVGLVVLVLGAAYAVLRVLEALLEKVIGKGLMFELLISAGLLVKKDRGRVERERTSIFGIKE